MTISGRIFQILEEKHMTRKEFSEKTGIALSSISDWKRKGTNPGAEKIMIIADTLGISVTELLSGNSQYNGRSREAENVSVSTDSEIGFMITSYQQMDDAMRKRLLGYVEALNAMRE